MKFQVNGTVILNVYDLSWTNEFTTQLGFGIFHTGVEVFGQEFAYDGHPFSFPGIYVHYPREPGGSYAYKQSIEIGNTNLTKPDIYEIIDDLCQKYIGNEYSLLERNCNHFTSELCAILCGKSIPNWINRLACVGTCVPFLIQTLDLFKPDKDSAEDCACRECQKQKKLLKARLP